MITIEDVTFTYAGQSAPAIENVSMQINDGEFYGIIGSAGAGKTTMASIINGAVPHCQKGDFYGTVQVDGADTFESTLTDLSQSVGTVFQDVDASMVSSVVEDEILFGLENLGCPRESIEARLAEALTDLGISELRHRQIADLSGGQKQKVVIAAVLAIKPLTLILDEPTGALDPASSLRVFQLLKSLNMHFGITVVVIEQKIGLLAQFAQKLAVMDQGSIILDGPVDQVLSHSAQLKEAGVNVPRVTDLSIELSAAGLSGFEPQTFTDVDGAESTLKKMIA